MGRTKKVSKAPLSKRKDRVTKTKINSSTSKARKNAAKEEAKAVKHPKADEVVEAVPPPPVQNAPSWSDMFVEMVLYKARHNGDVLVPTQYKGQNNLGRWVANQRSIYRKMKAAKGTGDKSDECAETDASSEEKGSGPPEIAVEEKSSYLCEDRITALDSLAFVWDVRNAGWEEKFNELARFKETHGHCDVPTQNPSTPLGRWVNMQRLNHGKQTRGFRISAEKIAKLESIGFTWRHFDRDGWDTRFQELVEYKKEKGDCKVPQFYENNRKLGKWVSKQRQGYLARLKGLETQLTDERLSKLEELGFVWGSGNRRSGLGILNKDSPCKEEEKPPHDEEKECSEKPYDKQLNLSVDLPMHM